MTSLRGKHFLSSPGWWGGTFASQTVADLCPRETGVLLTFAEMELDNTTMFPPGTNVMFIRSTEEPVLVQIVGHSEHSDAYPASFMTVMARPCCTTVRLFGASPCCHFCACKCACTGGGGIFGRGEFRGENFTVKKSGEIFPLAKFLQRVTGEYCEFRYAQRCTKQREGTRDVFVCNMQGGI